MGGTPTRHHSKSRRNKGRSHHALKQTNTTKCSNCKLDILAHTICPNCGFYKGRMVVDVFKKLTKKEKKKKEKELKNQKNQ